MWNNFVTKVSTNHGDAVISIPEDADHDDLMMVREVLDLAIKYHFKDEGKDGKTD